MEKNRDDAELKDFEKAVNEAAYALTKTNPALLTNRKELLFEAQKTARESYHFKKGFSRSVSAESQNKENPESKQSKTFKEERAMRLKELHEKISETKNMISYKMLRREKCAAVREWKTCETLSTEISKLLSQKGQLEREVLLLNKKEKKSHWYEKRKSTETSANKEKRAKTATSTATTSKQGKETTVDIRSALRIEKKALAPMSSVSSVVVTETTKATTATSQNVVLSGECSQGCSVTSKVQIDSGNATMEATSDL